MWLWWWWWWWCAWIRPWKKDGAKDLLDVFKHWKPWIPPKREQGFQQAREREREREIDDDDDDDASHSLP